MLLILIISLTYSVLGHSLDKNTDEQLMAQKTIFVSEKPKKPKWLLGLGLGSPIQIEQTDDMDSDGLNHNELGLGIWIKGFLTERISWDAGATRLTKEYSVRKEDNILLEEVQKFQTHFLGRYDLQSNISFGLGGFYDFKASDVNLGENKITSSELDTSASKSTYGPMVSLAYDKSLTSDYGLFASFNYQEPLNVEDGEELTKYYFMFGFLIRPQ